MSKILEAETAKLAEENGIPLYKARMLLYIKYGAQESRAAKIKEALKEAIVKELDHRHKHAAMTQIPDTDDQWATAYMYDQAQPRFDEELAKRLVTPDVLAQIYKRTPTTCFTVVPYTEKTAANLMRKTEEFYQKKTDTLEEQLRASVSKTA